ncbi:hypothetical protein D1159_18270 [Pseudoflavonifractor sp. 524-17]|nr:hypothetical protein [Pseudoflavonifractor sp. 524-17]
MRKSNVEYEFLSLLGKFITEYLPVSMNASPNTILSYKCAFRLLFQYLEEKTEIKTGHITFEMLNFDLLTDFFDWLVTVRKNSRTTAKQRMGALSSFAEYAQCRNLEAGCVFQSSLARIAKKSFRRVKGKQRSSFTRTELEILFSLPDPTEKLGWRDLVLLSVMYSSGARAQEICSLTVKDVMHDEKGNAILALTEKGEKSPWMQLSCWINISPTEESVTNLTGMSFPAKGIHVCRFPPLRRFLQNTSQWQRQRTRTSFAVARIRHM